MDLKHKKLFRISSLVFSVAAVLISCASNTHSDAPPLLFADKEENAETELKIHTLSLLSGSNGDCTLIEYGDTQVLIDCGGSKTASKDVIFNALKTYVTDGVLEYAIMSHGDGDHVANFVDDGAMGKWLADSSHKINFLIDFDNYRDTSLVGKYKNLDLICKSNEKYRGFVLSKSMQIRHHLSSSMCTYQNRGIEDDSDYLEQWKIAAKLNDKKYISNSYPLYADAENNYKLNPLSPTLDEFNMTPSKCTLKILYNYFYDHPVVSDRNEPNGIDKNVISTCCLIELETENSEPFKALFTGDLQEYYSKHDNKHGKDNEHKDYYSISAVGEDTAGGESLLVKYNKEEFKTPITYYKAAHHGSNTSNSPAFLETIRPVNVAISASAGANTQFDFPSGSIDKGNAELSAATEFSNYTDHIYITCIKEDGEDGNNGYKDYCGDINFSVNSKGETDVNFGNENTNKTIIDDEWYKNNRLFNTQVFNLTNDTHGAINCSYIKIGSIDILIGAGCDDTSYLAGANAITNKIDLLCNDRVLDYLIVPTPYISSWRYLLGNSKSYKYVLSGSKIRRVKNFIYYNSDNTSGDLYELYLDFLNKAQSLYSPVIDNFIPSNLIDKNININNNLKYGFYIDFDGYISDNFYIEFLQHQKDVLITNNGASQDKVTLSMYTLINSGKFRYLNLGDDYNYGFDENGDNSLITNNPEIYHSIHILQIPYFGYNKDGNNKKLIDFYNLVRINSDAVPLRGASPHEKSDAGKIDIYAFLNTNYGKSNGANMIYPINGRNYIQNAVFSAKKIMNNQEIAFRGDLCAKIALLNNRIFYYRFKSTKSLSDGEFYFYDHNAQRRSDAGKKNNCSPITNEEMEAFNI